VKFRAAAPAATHHICRSPWNTHCVRDGDAVDGENAEARCAVARRHHKGDGKRRHTKQRAEQHDLRHEPRHAFRGGGHDPRTIEAHATFHTEHKENRDAERPFDKAVVGRRQDARQVRERRHDTHFAERLSSGERQIAGGKTAVAKMSVLGQKELHQIVAPQSVTYGLQRARGPAARMIPPV
jgi:hypothetical protein